MSKGNEQMISILAAIANELLFCDDITSYYKKELKESIETREFGKGYLRAEFERTIDASLTEKASCTLCIRFDCQNEYEEPLVDEHGNVYRNYELVPYINWSSWGEAPLAIAQGRIDLINYVMAEAKRICESYISGETKLVVKHIIRTKEQEEARIAEQEEIKKKEKLIYETYEAIQLASKLRNVRVGSSKVITGEDADKLPEGTYKGTHNGKSWVVSKTDGLVVAIRTK